MSCDSVRASRPNRFQVLRGNAVFTVEVVGDNRRAGTLFLVHPMEENDCRFLPCCYGYATTIRRAQGASLVQGCLWFNQARRAAGRGYGYVGVSRFRSKDGCYLVGKARRTDFLLVGEADPEREVLERGVDSESDDSDDEFVDGLAQRDWGNPDDESDCDDPEASGDLIVRGDCTEVGDDAMSATTAGASGSAMDMDQECLFNMGTGSFGADVDVDDVPCLNDFV